MCFQGAIMVPVASIWSKNISAFEYWKICLVLNVLLQHACVCARFKCPVSKAWRWRIPGESSAGRGGAPRWHQTPPEFWLLRVGGEPCAPGCRAWLADLPALRVLSFLSNLC